MLPTTRQLLERGLALYQQGQFAACVKQYDAVLRMEPSNFDALHLKGLALYQSGAPAEALVLLTKAIRQKDSFPQAHNNRGLTHQALGKRSQALRDFSKAIELNSGYAEAYCNKANVLREMGRLPEATAACMQALRLNPNIAEFHNSLGVIHKESSNWPAALVAFETALKLRPNYLEALVNVANVLKSLKRFEDAVTIYNKALALRPDWAEVHGNRGSALKDLERPEDALASFDAAIRLDPLSADFHSSRGDVLRELKRIDEAMESCRKALSLKPDHAPSWLVLGRIHAEMAQFDEARRSYEMARQLDPDAIAPLYGMVWIGKFSAEDPLLGHIEHRLGDVSISDEDRAFLHHAFGKLCNDVGRYDESMAHFSAGKKLLAVNFDMDKYRENLEAMKQLFTPSFFAERQGFGVADERPVFIVGMPRSGTTLVEQIIASHHQARGLGELPHMERIARSVGGSLRDLRLLAEGARRLGAADVTRLASRYQEAYARSEPVMARLADKMPQNFLWLGLIALMFPKAHIIHCRRDSLDTCVSIYMQSFIDRHDYGKDMTTLGAYYRCYEDLMEHWRQFLPIPIHDCVYETLVGDFEGSVRSLVDFLGLEWDPNCLDYHQRDRQVSSASLWQVRQPLFDTSVGRWRRYEKHLGPLREALGRSEGV